MVAAGVLVDPWVPAEPTELAPHHRHDIFVHAALVQVLDDREKIKELV